MEGESKMNRRKFGITYVMRNKVEVAESYIEIPSVFNLEEPEECPGAIENLELIIRRIASLQGYNEAVVETIEEVDE